MSDHPSDSPRSGPAPVALTVADAMAVLGCSRPTVYARIKAGDLRMYKLGRATRLNAHEVYALVGATPPSPDPPDGPADAVDAPAEATR